MRSATLVESGRSGGEAETKAWFSPVRGGKGLGGVMLMYFGDSEGGREEEWTWGNALGSVGRILS